MPNKIKSKAQMRYLQGIAHGMTPKGGGGSSPAKAAEMVAAESKARLRKLPEHAKRKK